MALTHVTLSLSVRSFYRQAAVGGIIQVGSLLAFSPNWGLFLLALVMVFGPIKPMGKAPRVIDELEATGRNGVGEHGQPLLQIFRGFYKEALPVGARESEADTIER